MQNASWTTDNQLYYFGWDTVFPLFNLSSPNYFFFPIFRFVTNFQSPYHSLCIRKPISSCNPCKYWPPLTIPYFFPRKCILSPWLPFTLTMQTCRCSRPKGYLKIAFLCCLKSNRETAANVPLAMVIYMIYFAFILRYLSVSTHLVFPFSVRMICCCFFSLFTQIPIVLYDAESHVPIYTLIFLLLYQIFLKNKE